MTRGATLAALALVHAGCGGATPISETSKPAPTAARPEPTAPAEPVPSAVAEPSVPSSGRFAPSPLTHLADQLVSVTLAAVRGESLPNVDFPIERPSGGEDRLVSGDQPVPRDLDFLAIAMELEIALQPSRQDGSGPPGEDPPNGLETMVFLSRHGLKLLSLEPGGVSRAVPPPRWLPVGDLTQQLLADLRSGSIDRWWVGDAEKALVGPKLARELDKERSDADDVRRARELAQKSSTLHGVRIDDVALVARAPDGEVWGFKLQFESGDEPELDARPLVRVRRSPEDR